MRSKRALVNIGVTLILQVVAIASGLIVPKLIIVTYGSEVNGLLISITQFLSYIVLLEAGVGGVVRAALYKPLAKKNFNAVSRIIKASEKFFKTIAIIFSAYLVGLAFLYPHIVSNSFDKYLTASLVIIIGLSSFFQYFFGISYQILLQADQKQYVLSIIQIFTVIINTILVIVLIKFEVSVFTLKLVSTFVFILRPLLLFVYVNKKYNIDRKIKADNESLKQKWDGLGHHIAFLIHNNTDIALLTFFTNLKEVSVYSIYLLITSSIKQITVTFSSGIEAAFGNIIANKEKDALERNFILFEVMTFTITTILFTTLVVLILPFISLYTAGIDDVNYIRPTFAYILIAAEASFCIRIPYSAVVLAAGHYKQTRNGAFMEAAINLGVSIILISIYGIIGVAIGTLFAVIFRTLQYATYLSKNILQRKFIVFMRTLFVYISCAVSIIWVTSLFPENLIKNYYGWIIYALQVFSVSVIISAIYGLIFFLNEYKTLFYMLKKILIKKFA